MGVSIQVPCPGCGFNRTLRYLGITEDGRFRDGEPRELQVHIHHFKGRGRISIERQPLPANIAIGLRNMLRARLAQVEAELAAAGVEDAGQDAA